ncbi:DUF2335 domain-containing protein [Xanthomonas citri]|uniref:DUF2335 domain-containing protein n=1 Tax=Xanthomonas citri TaxID=346 RepID=UPI001CBAC9E8
MSGRKQSKKPANARPQATPNALNQPTVRTAELRIGQQQTIQQVTHHYATQSSWEGPLPPPKLLAEFNELQPGLADRIVRWAEQEGEHNRKIETRSLNWSIATRIIGQVFAATLAVGCLYASYHLAMAGHEGVAMTLGGGTLTTIVFAFLSSRKSPTPPK